MWNRSKGSRADRVDLISSSQDLQQVVDTYNSWNEEQSRLNRQVTVNRKVFIDLDGVLSDFDRGVTELFNGRKVSKIFEFPSLFIPAELPIRYDRRIPNTMPIHSTLFYFSFLYDGLITLLFLVRSHCWSGVVLGISISCCHPNYIFYTILLYFTLYSSYTYSKYKY